MSNLTITELFYSHSSYEEEFSSYKNVLGVYTSPFLDTGGLKMVLRARKVSGAFEKRPPGPVQTVIQYRSGAQLCRRVCFVNGICIHEGEFSLESTLKTATFFSRALIQSHSCLFP